MMSATQRPLRGGFAAVPGFRSAAATGGIKPSGKPDVSVIVADAPCPAAACFTTNRVVAAPVIRSKAIARRAKHRAVVINSGNANACTGEAGLANAEVMQAEVAALARCSPNEVFVCSTGVIGVPLPMPAVTKGIRLAFAGLDDPPAPAANGIMTTDTTPKEIAWQCDAGYALAGIAKGSGMIKPNMATMLAVILTDARVGKRDLQRITKRATARSFNRISVDNDTSTNDTVVVMASGASGVAVSSENDLERFEAHLTEQMQALAQLIVRDGEGATSFITIEVTGAANEDQANDVARAVADSMLVKTAFAGRDPNWGRIACAIGYSGVPIDSARMTIELNGVCIYDAGLGRGTTERPFTDVASGKRRTRAWLAKRMGSGDQTLRIDLDTGLAQATRWTADLTHGYITINADYTT